MELFCIHCESNRCHMYFSSLDAGSRLGMGVLDFGLLDAKDHFQFYPRSNRF